MQTQDQFIEENLLNKIVNVSNVTISQYPYPIFKYKDINNLDKNILADFLDVYNIFIQNFMLNYSLFPNDYRATNDIYLNFLIDSFNLSDLRLTGGDYTNDQIYQIFNSNTIIYNTQGSYYCLRFFYNILEGLFDDDLTNVQFYYDGSKNFDGSWVFGKNNLNPNVPISFVEGSFIINATVLPFTAGLLLKFKSARDLLVVTSP